MTGDAVRTAATFGAAVVFASVAVNVSADAFLDALRADLPSAATLESGGDAEDSRDYTLDVDIALPDGNRAQLSATRADVHTDAGDYTSEAWRLGIASDPLAPVDYGFGYAALERDDKVSADSVDGFLRWRPGGWTLAAYPQLRMISLGNNVNDLRVGIRNPGFGAEVGYQWDSGISISARRDAYEYSLDSDELSRMRLLTRVASTRIAQEFDIERNRLRLGYTLASLDFELAWTQRVSAIDHAESNTLEAGARWNLHRNVTVFGRYGRVRDADDRFVDFAGGGVTLLWE